MRIRNHGQTSGTWSTYWFEKNLQGDIIALYDNDRFRDENAWHEQIFAVKPSYPSEDNDTMGLVIEFDFYTGGWEGEHIDFSLLDFGHAEANMKIEDEKLQIGAYGAFVEVGNGFCVSVAKAIGFSFSIVPAN